MAQGEAAPSPDLEKLLGEALLRELVAASERIVKSLKEEHAYVFRAPGLVASDTAIQADEDRDVSLSAVLPGKCDPSYASEESCEQSSHKTSSWALRRGRLQLETPHTKESRASTMPKVFARKSFFVTQEVSKEITHERDARMASKAQTTCPQPEPATYKAIPAAEDSVGEDTEEPDASVALSSSNGDKARRMIVHTAEGVRDPASALATQALLPQQQEQHLCEGPKASPAKSLWQAEESLDKIGGILILANALFMFVETDYMARTWADKIPPTFEVIDAVFCILFIVELSLRVAPRGIYFWSIRRSGWEWNYFDTVVIGLQGIEHGVKVLNWFCAVGHVNNNYGLKIFRIARLFRTVRLIRAVHLVKELHMITLAIFRAIRSLMWTIVLMTLLMFCLSIFLTQVVTDYKTHSATPPESQLLDYFGSMDRSMLTLYMVISQGVQWRDATYPLEEHVSKVLVVVFIIYIAFTLFGLTNIVTSVFVESVIQAREEHGRDALLNHVKKAFLGSISSADRTDTITVTEFAKHMKDEEMIMYLKAIDLSPDDAIQLFNLVDVEGTGEIPVEEFLSGCLRLPGSAKAIDLAILTAETRAMNTQLSELLCGVEGTVERLERRMCGESR